MKFYVLLQIDRCNEEQILFVILYIKNQRSFIRIQNMQINAYLPQRGSL